MNPYTAFCRVLMLICVFCTYHANAQSKLVLNGAYINIHAGTAGTPIYLVVEDSLANAVTRNSGHIISESEYNFLKRNLDTFQTAFLYPFGIGTTTYLPFTYTKTNATPVKLAFSTWGTNMQNNPHPTGVTHMLGAGDSLTSAIDRFWTMQSNNASSGDFNFSYNGTENTTTNPTTSVFTAQYWNGSDWSAAPAGGSTGVTAGVGSSSLPFSTASGQYPFVLVRTDFTLPLDLIRFTAEWQQAKKRTVMVQWNTASEMDILHYEIQRSLDGVHFDSIGTTRSNGNSTNFTSYSFEDVSLPIHSTQFFYRLKIVENNFTSKTTGHRFLDRNSSVPVTVKVFPNPFERQIQLQFSKQPFTAIQINVVDLNGKIIYNSDLSIQKNKYSHVIHLNDLAAGFYFINLQFNEETHSFKLLKN